MKKLLCVAMALCLMLTAVAALAEGTVKVTATVNMRSGAGTEYSVVGNAQKNQTFAYNKTAKDSRGVVWYRVNNNSKGAWISSKYASLK